MWFSVFQHKGLWIKNTSLSLNDACSAECSSCCFDKNRHNSIVYVQVVSLDNALKKLVKTVNFIKMDVEGAEIEAIKGCKTILKSNDVKLAIAS